MMIGQRPPLSLAAAGLLPGCSPAPPWRIGYLGDLAHHTARDGLEGRNGAIPGTEALNTAGGIQRRRVELLVHDEGTEAAATRAAVRATVGATLQATVQSLSRAQPGESPRDAVLRHGPDEGLLQRIRFGCFDRFGDAQRQIQFLQVRNGRFQPIP